MKKLLLSIAIMASTILSAQNMTPVTRAEVNEINLKIESFAKKQKLGSRIITIGSLTAITGAFIINRNYGMSNYLLKNNPWYGGATLQNRSFRTGQNIMLVGLGITSIGVSVKLNSYKKLTKRRKLSISLK